jgi:uncharacterized UBP type Zn finger protein
MITDHINEIMPTAVKGRQEDAHEFLISVLEMIKDYTSMLLSYPFDMQLINEICCLKCNISCELEKVTQSHLQVDIKKVI